MRATIHLPATAEHPEGERLEVDTSLDEIMRLASDPRANLIIHLRDRPARRDANVPTQRSKC